MTRRRPRGRSGITLTEILISILIMGVGVISLATLFPLGLIRMRNAQRLTRGAYLVESAMADMGTRNLLAKNSFYGNFAVSPWYRIIVPPVPPKPQSIEFYDPWVQDTSSYGATAAVPGVFRSIGVGLPVAYDPLWRCVTGIYPDNLGGTSSASVNEVRFGSGIGFLRDEPNPVAKSSIPSAHGLQRITNLQANVSPTSSPLYVPAKGLSSSITQGNTSDAQFSQNTSSVLEAFVSPEDFVLQDAKGSYQDPNAAAGVRIANPSTVVPDLTTSGTSTPTHDWRFTWFFTGQQDDATDGSLFDGDIVICENRPFGLDLVTSPLPSGGSVFQPAGETVVEAVWNWSTSADPPTLGLVDSSQPTVGYGSPSGRRSVLLRWPVGMADPDVRVGSWIADVTYERTAAENPRFSFVYPGQRIYWYQVTKRTEATADPGFSDDMVGSTKVTYRRMTVTVGSPIRSRTPLNFNATTPSLTRPFHVESALIMPSVVNVYPRTIYSR